MNTPFTIKDMNKKLYSLHFQHRLFWEIEFLEGSCAVISRNGALTKNGDKIPDSIQDEEIKTHDNLLLAIQDAQTRINKKIQFGGYTLADSDATPALQSTPTGSTSENQINQKRSAESQGFDLSSAKESLFKKLHAIQMSSSSTTPGESNSKSKEEKAEENHSRDDAEDFQQSNPGSPQNEEQPVLNLIPEERKGAYLEKIECGETLTYKIQISKNKLMIEEGKLSEPKKHTEIKIYLNYEEARQRMELRIKEKKDEGYKNIEKKFVYNFQSRVRGQNKPQRPTQVPQQNAPRKHPVQEEEERPLTDSNLKRLLRSQAERNYATELQEALSYQTRCYCSYRPIEWSESEDPTGLILREKLSGVLCVWDGKDKLISLNRHEYKVPEEFIRGFPPVSLLGVVYLGPGSSYYVEMNLRSSDFEKWKNMKFVVYDIFNTDLPFKERMETIEELFKEINSPYIELCKYTECKDKEHFQNEQEIIKEKKGDGILLNKPNSKGLSGVNAGLYVWKNYTFEEAELLNRIYDENGDVKSLEVRHPKGDNIFKIHKGIAILEKEEVPKIGDIIIYKTMGEKSKNVPKMPVFVGIKSSDETE